MNVDWAVAPPDNPGGNSMGYTVANTRLRDALLATGVTFDVRAEVAVHVCTPMAFVPVPDRRNVLYTMWESPDFPERMRMRLGEADLVLVPSRFCADLFRPFCRSVAVVPLGVDLDLYRPPAAPREWVKGESFQWLAVGAPNARKGWDVILDVWNHVFKGRPECHLYIKIMGSSDAMKEALGDGWTPHPKGVLVRGNAILDMRRLPAPLLARTYQMSHGFLYPTSGEGFGLTLLEAMATGLPAIVTRYSGVLDFTSADCVRYVDWTPEYAVAEVEGDGEHPDLTLNCAMAKPQEVVDQMMDVMGNYRAARRMGQRAARAARGWSWPRAGQRLRSALDDFCSSRAA